MPIKNYTTKIEVFVSVGEIQGALATHGARKIMVDYDTKGEPMAISFVLETARGLQGFILPVVVEGVLEVFKKQKLKVDIEQASRTAWRNIRDWVLAQMALIESCGIPADQVFLPYLSDTNGRTLYEIYCSGVLAIGD